MERSAVWHHFPTLISVWAWLRSRITARRVKVAVALVGVALIARAECMRRAERFRGLADHHRSWIKHVLWGLQGFHSGHENDEVHYYHADGKEFTGLEMARLKWHGKLGKKYFDASLRPWLPVAPDPPEPK